MSKAKPAALGAGLVAKGQAAPAASEHPATPTVPVAVSGLLARQGYYKAITIKLSRDRYVALKAAGVAEDKYCQDILVEALDTWLATRRLNT